MIRTIIVIIGLMTLIPACAQNNKTGQGIEQMNWLVGQWQRQNTRSNRNAYEVWQKTESGELIGIGVTLQGADTVFVEHLKITKKDGKLYYVAEVEHNPAPTYFEVVEIGMNAFVSTNPSHDFPKKISYSLSGDGVLNATISGDGKQMTLLFNRMTPKN